ncbi:hypothetical protein MIR68_007209 [Amoeboaphelidium protococcarum]|nr:hypothetical protein MIR68_007209 [Amoeboaphelidium protococcarum]
MHLIKEKIIPHHGDQENCALQATEYQHIDLLAQLDKLILLRGYRICQPLIKALNRGAPIEYLQAVVTKFIGDLSLRQQLLDQILLAGLRPDASAWLTSQLRVRVSENALKYACDARHWETASILLTHFAKTLKEVRSRYREIFFNLPTQEAVNFVRFLLPKCSVDQITTVLQLAAELRQFAVFELILKTADVDASQLEFIDEFTQRIDVDQRMVITIKKLIQDRPGQSPSQTRDRSPVRE